jgi:crotonobetainyl-CoA:carnitine CoA-transferase CaiB-like acyl-CoA transferase
MFDGYRVLELGTWVLVPAAATVLADFGAEVIKIEHPRRGDPQRGLSTGGVTPNVDGVSIAMEQTNRGKRSVGLDVAVDEGREVLYELAAGSDVFMTSFLPAARQKLRIDVEHIRARNPDTVYVRADALGRGAPRPASPATTRRCSSAGPGSWTRSTPTVCGCRPRCLDSATRPGR